MRLLNSKTLELEYFEVPPDSYAILSHTWGDNEVEHGEYRDMPASMRQTDCPEKVLYLCQQAVKDKLNYAWVDTICIDKSSSAELSEAINSMFSWYCNASICYAYLDDVDQTQDIKASRWIKRGWTLQELIAPEFVDFYGRDWQPLGSKSNMAEDLSSWTRIDSLVLLERETLEEFSIATRMQWASNRETTRVEDMAYCLMGIFNVNMPLMYGEAHNAFVRLQEEILKRTQDDSILAWMHENGQGNYLPSKISSFASNRKVVCTDAQHHSFEFTELGLRMNLPVLVETVTERSYRHRNVCIRYCECPGQFQREKDSLRMLHWAVLNCRFERSFEGYVAIEVAERGGRWYRVGTRGSLRVVPQDVVDKTERRDITLRSNLREPLFPYLVRTTSISTRSVCTVEVSELLAHGFGIAHFSRDARNRCWNANTMVSEVLSAEGVTATIVRYFVLFHQEHREAVIITTVNHLYSWDCNDNVLYFECDFPGDQHLEEVVSQAKNQVNGLRAQWGPFSPQQIRQLERGMKKPDKWFATRKQHPYAIARAQEDLDGVSVLLGSWKRHCHTDFEITFAPKTMLGTQVWVLQISASGCQRQQRHKEQLSLPEMSPDRVPLSSSLHADVHPRNPYESASPTFQLDSFVHELEEVR